MRFTLPDLTPEARAQFDTIIDVRSPAEFAEDHIPGAINLPVLDDAERAEVGTIYKQRSPFDARKIGAALVARNSGYHVEHSLMQKTGGWQPLVYCWRGGQRSGAFSTILQQIGWRVQTLEGGYQSYRRHVVAALYEDPVPHHLIRLDGYTGTGKTVLLQMLRAKGVQVLDLEGLANHRGSFLGGQVTPQPSQKQFETRVALALVQADPLLPLVVESEGSKIGGVSLPTAFWRAMCQAPRLLVDAPIAARATFLAERYADLTDDPEALCGRLDRLRRFQGHEAVDAWQRLARDQHFAELAQALVTAHYDPAYLRVRRGNADIPIATFATQTLDETGLTGLADQIARRLVDL
jgi:tRNA 2-selenouridine synthase